MRGHRVSRGGALAGLATGLTALTLLAGPAGAQPAGGDLVTRGRYIFAAAAGCGCHTEKGKVEPGKTTRCLPARSRGSVKVSECQNSTRMPSVIAAAPSYSAAPTETCGPSKNTSGTSTSKPRRSTRSSPVRT
jgi:hypothetical protein